MFERYTEKARRMIVQAKHEADRFGAPEIAVEHILLALLNDSALISDTVERASTKEIREAITSHLTLREQNSLPHDLPLSAESRRTLALAVEEADCANQRHIENEHILLALIQFESYAAGILKDRGFSVDKLRRRIAALPESASSGSVPKRNLPPAEIELVKKVTETIRRVAESMGHGNFQDALRLLEEFMAEPGQDRKNRMLYLGYFAVETASRVGDLETARRYCEEMLSYSPENPMVLYAIAECLATQSETDQARQYVARCRALALSPGNKLGEHLIPLLDSLEKRFPDLKAG
jgi:hypothetical protein